MKIFELREPQILGIDYGQKKIGLALAPQNLKIATPYRVIPNLAQKEAINKIIEICLSENVVKIVIGFPYSLRNKKVLVFSTWTDKVKSFATRLSQQSGLETVIEDERLSTKIVRSLKINFGIKNKLPEDAISAAVILQSYLDKAKD